MALEAPTNTQYFFPSSGPSLDIEVATLAPRYPSSPHHLFPRAHSGSSASIKSERASPLHFDSSLHTALTFRPAPSSTTPSSSTDTFRFSNAPHLSLPLLLDVDQHQSSPSSRISMASSPHSAHIPDGWSLKRSNAPPSVHAPVLPLDLGDMSHTDEYDDELVDFPFTGSLASQGSHNEKIIRRRSSKGAFFPAAVEGAHHAPRHSLRPVPQEQMQMRAHTHWGCMQKLCYAQDS